MIRQFSFLLLVSTLLPGCQNQKSVYIVIKAKLNTHDSSPLETQLRAIDTNFSTGSVQLSFTVVNHADIVQYFCKWETPFDPFLGKYMLVINEQGTEARFKGPMTRRIMPPPSESYIQVQPHDCASTVYNLAKNYTIKSGSYSVKYTGGSVSGLQSGNEIKIVINGQ